MLFSEQGTETPDNRIGAIAELLTERGYTMHSENPVQVEGETGHHAEFRGSTLVEWNCRIAVNAGRGAVACAPDSAETVLESLSTDCGEAGPDLMRADEWCMAVPAGWSLPQQADVIVISQSPDAVDRAILGSLGPIGEVGQAAREFTQGMASASARATMHDLSVANGEARFGVEHQINPQRGLVRFLSDGTWLVGMTCDEDARQTACDRVIGSFRMQDHAPGS